MVAIVGMAFKFPGGAETPAALWRILEEGSDCVGAMPPGRAALFPKVEDDCPMRAGYLEDVSSFDNGFFNINGLEARTMDPQQRILLETVWAALEDGGFRASLLRGKPVGVFAGVHTQDYWELCLRAGIEVNAYWNAGLNTSIHANRISYCLDLTGPSVTVNTACASGLEAVSQAVAALCDGRCEMAVAAGANLILTPTVTRAAARAGMISARGRCSAFDAAADGFVRGEGIAALVLKPLERALEDGDPIYAVIKSAVSRHGGHANSLTSPNLRRQRDLLIEAYTRAGVDPATVGFMEAHGTGTRLGDSVEMEALKEAFAALLPDRVHLEPFCGVGSVKTNFGHLESAAGLAGIVKVCLAMQRQTLPANVHFQKPNPLIELAGTPFTIVAEPRPWPAPSEDSGAAIPRRAGVSSFGFGGAMTHAVLEEAPVPRLSSPPTADAELVILSACDETRLAEAATRLAAFLEGKGKSPSLAEIAHTLRIGREAMAARLAMVVADERELAQKLTSFLETRGSKPDYFLGGLQRTASVLRKQTQGTTCGGLGVMNRNRLAALADRWSKGEDFEWSLGKEPYRRLGGLPTYPFAKKRHWMADVDT